MACVTALQIRLPSVTAVIPTRNRPGLLHRAIDSALSQTYPNLEVVVVVDGYQQDTVQLLHSIVDDRLRPVVLMKPAGGAEARNAGVQHARGEWIAFLDDDDEWLTTKIERQMERLLHSRFDVPVASCRIIARTPLCDYIWPRKQPSQGVLVGDYLFCRNSLFQGEGLLPTPTIVARRDLLTDVPFRALSKHEDWDWFLRAAQMPGFGIEFCPEPLAICHMEEDRAGISNTDNWELSLSWARSNRDLLTARSYASFLLTIVASSAGIAIRERLGLLAEALRSGKPSLTDISVFWGMWFVPRRVRRRVRAALTGKRCNK